MHRFESIIFTPTKKSENDEPVRSRYVRRQYPAATNLTGRVFERMSDYLEPRGITLIDGKFEAAGGVLIDEWGTGDCCRMAWTKDVQEGVDPPWLDKEYFRQAAERAWGSGPKTALAFDAATVEEGVRKYHVAFETITEQTLSDFKRRHLD
jgi:phosphoribosylaminoimidazole-succinocarboxamide synthase